MLSFSKFLFYLSWVIYWRKQVSCLGSFFTFFVIFFTEFRELMPFLILFVPAWIMMQSGLSATKFSILSNIFSEIPTGKCLTVTWWFFESPFSLIPLRRESPVTVTFFFLFILTICASFLGISESTLSSWEDCCSYFFFLEFGFAENSKRL